MGRVATVSPRLPGFLGIAAIDTPNSPASIGLRTFYGSFGQCWLGCLVYWHPQRRHLILPLTCICARCRDSVQRPCFAEFRPACAAQRRGRQARMACGLGLAAQPRDCRDYACARARALRAGAARTRHRKQRGEQGRVTVYGMLALYKHSRQMRCTPIP